jgi:hypothetical protein
LLKERILAKDPVLVALPKSEASLKRLCEVVTRVWLVFDEELLNRLINRIVNRVEAVRRAKGWYSKY